MKSLRLKYKLLLAGIFFLFAFWQIVFENKTFLTVSANKILEGTINKNIYNNSELTVIDPGGFSWIDYPLSQVNSYKIRNKKLPLWNEFSGAGQPLFNNQTSQALSVIRYVFPLNLFPTAFVWDAFIVFRLIIFSVLIYLFLKAINIDDFIALSISLVAAINGYFLMYINLFHLDVEIFLPLLFLGIEKLITERVRWIFPFAIWLIVVGGNIQSTVVAAISGSIYFFIRLFFIDRSRRNKLIREFLVLTIIGFGIASYYLLPFVEYFFYSFHVHSIKTGSSVFDISTIPGFFSPFSFGPIHARWFKSFSQHSIPSYIGIIPILAIFALWKFSLFKNNKYNKFFIPMFFVFVFFILKLFNPYFSKLIGSFYILNRILFTKYNFPLYFSIYVLLAIILDFYKSNKAIKINNVLLFISFTGIILLELYSLRVIVKAESIEALKYFKVRYIIYNNGIQFALAYFFVFLLPLLQERLNNRVLINYVIFFLVLESIVNINLLIKKKSSRYDIFRNPAKYTRFLKEHQKKNSPWRIYGYDRIFYSQIPAGFLIEDLRTLDALTVNNHINFMRNFVTGINNGDYAFFSGGKIFKNKNAIKFLEASNVKYLLINKENKDVKQWLIGDRYTKVFEDDPIEIYKLDSLPRVYVPKRVIISSDLNKIKSIMLNKEFNPKNTAVIQIINDKEGEFICRQTKVKILNYSGDRIKAKINNSCDRAFAVISNTFFPGWKVKINDKKTRIFSANFAYIGIPLKKGINIVEINYSPSLFYFGLIISIGFLFCFFIFLKLKSFK